MERFALAFTLISVLASAVAGSSTPDTCRTTFDAAARIRGELFFFKDHYFWRINQHDQLMTREPVPVDSFWKGLSDSVPIDAAYERPDGSVVFFSGRYFWLVWERHAISGYPRPLSDLGLPEETSHVDVALVSGHNRATYLITGDQYWRFNELTKLVEKDSPLPISLLCRGLPKKLDTAFHHPDGVTYYIQGHHYWQCDPNSATVRSYVPDLVTPRWFGCSLVQCCLQEVGEATETKVQDVMSEVWGDGNARKRSRDGDGNGAEMGRMCLRKFVVLSLAAVVALIVV